MRPDTLTWRPCLAASITLALAGCGGDTTPSTSPDPSLSHSTTTATKAQTATVSPRTKAPDTEALPLLTDNSIRGDLLIQALLSQTGRMDANNRPLLSWLAPEARRIKALWSGSSTESPLSGPVRLARESITPDSANTGLGDHIYALSLEQGPMRGYTHAYTLAGMRTSPLRRPFTVRIGLSAPGIPDMGRVTSSPPQTLVLGPEARLYQVDAPLPTSPLRLFPPQDLVFRRPEGAQTIHADQMYQQQGTTRSLFGWSVDEAVFYEGISLTLNPDPANNRFSTCLDLSIPLGGGFQWREYCHHWEVPDGWSAGQPLIHRYSNMQEYMHYFGESTVTEDWDNHPWRERAEPWYVLPSHLKTTGRPIDGWGISGALLAAMLDAWSPRAKGMEALPPYAGAAELPHVNSAASHTPERVGIHIQNRVNAYVDGSQDTDTFSPAIGPYLYSLRVGAVQPNSAALIGTTDFQQAKLALHISADPQQGITLPRWVGLRIPHPTKTAYIGELLSHDGKTKRIAPQERILFGSPVQSWVDNNSYSNLDWGDARVQLTVEKVQSGAGSVDLCWHIASDRPGTQVKVICTSWTVPAQWQPGQPLKPHGYYVVNHPPKSRENEFVYWNTLRATP